jgi:hypothetical protein
MDETKTPPKSALWQLDEHLRHPTERQDRSRRAKGVVPIRTGWLQGSLCTTARLSIFTVKCSILIQF